MFGEDDTIDPDRHPHTLPSAVAPSSPPWFDDLTDTHHDNGGTSNSLVAGTGQTDETYEETGTYYMCYRQVPFALRARQPSPRTHIVLVVVCTGSRPHGAGLPNVRILA